ncbi:PREDICTED: calcium-dependent phospholipase A2 isoform X3 [Rhinopithecus bieti]|uniref:calcium-dependent phospholipase A2 isoform X3 n=1 Tax=Rhinopithecus bieti TaxID=61621 RepID=UPI00083BDC98|nr:PREDICTED: calcium-dependent phospholipase A2 isoform X3 [Rhinopithecus bieti]
MLDQPCICGINPTSLCVPFYSAEAGKPKMMTKTSLQVAHSLVGETLQHNMIGAVKRESTWYWESSERGLIQFRSERWIHKTFWQRTLEMKGFLPLVWFLACSVPAVQGGLLDLKSMIEKVTGKNALTNYGFYGCYCGWGGRGTPKDGTDRLLGVFDETTHTKHPVQGPIYSRCSINDTCHGRGPPNPSPRVLTPTIEPKPKS